MFDFKNILHKLILTKKKIMHKGERKMLCPRKIAHASLKKIGPSLTSLLRHRCRHSNPILVSSLAALWWVENTEFSWASFPGGTQKSFIRGGSAPMSNPFPFYIPFFQKRHPFRGPFIGKRHPFHIPSLEDLGISR